MPKKSITCTVFLASPSDVPEERKVLQDIIGEINSTLSRRIGIRLDLWKWETDAFPGIGTDPQEVVNAQIPENYECFVGIFWLTVGTPTDRAESGAVEEYESAKSRFDKDPNSVRIMLYFKNELPLSLSEIDAKQFKKVMDFKKRVSKEGALYREFTSTEDFRHSVRNDLFKFAYKLHDYLENENRLDSDRGEDDVFADGCEQECAADDEVDDGLFDLEEEIEEEIIALSAVSNRIGKVIETVGESMEERTKELNALSDAGNKEHGNVLGIRGLRSSAKLITRQASLDINDFSKNMKEELPLFQQHLDKTVNTFSKTVPIYLELGSSDTELKEVVLTFLTSLDDLIAALEGFYASIRDLPKMSSALVRSKREAQHIVREVVEIAKGGRASLDSLLSLFD